MNSFPFFLFWVLEHACPRILSFLTMYMFSVHFVKTLKTRHRSSCSCEQMFWLERESSWKWYLLTCKMDHSFHRGISPNLKLRLALFPLHKFSSYGRKSLFTLFIIWGEVLNLVLNINLTYSSKKSLIFHYETISLTNCKKIYLKILLNVVTKNPHGAL